MATEFDLSSLTKGQPIKNQKIMSDRTDMDIPVPSPKNVDPIFDTPPVYKIDNSRSDSDIHSIDSTNSTTITRTPTIPTPSKEDKRLINRQVRGDDEPVQDPVPLKVINNIVPKTTSEDLNTPFDINSLPKPKPPVGEDEQDAYDALNAAVDRECKSITERIHALTEKQYEELLDAKQNGIRIDPPKSDEEVEAELIASIEHNNNTKSTIIEDDDSVVGVKKIVVHDDDDDDSILMETSNQTRVDNLVREIGGVIQYVKLHVVSKDPYTKAMHGANWLAKNGVYAAMYSIIMHNDNNEAVAHPMLVVHRDDIIAIIEVNDTGANGIHILDSNDTIESVCTGFVHKGLLYDYVDHLNRITVVKMPVDQVPTKELAIDLANDNKRGNTNMGIDKNNQNNMDAEKIYDTPNIVVGDDEDDKVDDYPDKNKVDEIEPEKFDVLYDQPNEDNDYDDEIHLNEDIRDSIDQDTESETLTHKVFAEDADIDDDSITISKNALEEDTSNDNMTEYESVISDDIEKDLAKELNEDGPTDDQILDSMRAAVKEHSNSIKNRINLKDFKISDTPISAAQVATFSIKDINQADWVLPNAKRVITVRGLSGPELFALNPQNSNKNKINTFRQIYGIIYKHIVSKKPKTFDEWLKVTRFSDIDHIYAALHKATFAGSNFVHYECPECHHIFIKDYNFDKDMVTYSNDKARTKIQNIMRSNDSSIPDYEVKLYQISDRYAVGLKDPSIWNMVMETAALSDEFLAKYEDLIDTMSFIDSVYLISTSDNTLQPIDFGYNKNEPAKSTARKISILSDIIRTLSSDNYFILRGHIAKLFSSSNDIGYQIPATDCPKCNHHFEAESTEAIRMLFTRHQLGALEII